MFRMQKGRYERKHTLATPMTDEEFRKVTGLLYDKEQDRQRKAHPHDKHHPSKHLDSAPSKADVLKAKQPYARGATKLGQKPKDEISKMKESLEKWKKKHESVLSFMTRTSRRLDKVMEKSLRRAHRDFTRPSQAYQNQLCRLVHKVEW